MSSSRLKLEVFLLYIVSIRLLRFGKLLHRLRGDKHPITDTATERIVEGSGAERGWALAEDRT